MSHNARRIIAGWDNQRMVKGFREAIEYAIGHSDSLESLDGKRSLPSVTEELIRSDAIPGQYINNR